MAQFTKFNPGFKRQLALAALRLAAMALLLAAVPRTSMAQGRVLAVSGQVQIQRGDRLLPVVVGTRLQEGDEFSSENQSEALVRFDDGARLAIRTESRLLVKDLRLKGPAASRQKTIRLVQGALRYISGKSTARSRVLFETTTATVGIRGTDIELAVSPEPVNTDPAGTYLKVNTGLATLVAADGTQVDVDPGQVAFGGDPELVARGPGGIRRPAARKLEAPTGSLFKGGVLDKLMR